MRAASRIGATDDETFGFGGTLDRAAEHQGLDLVVKPIEGKRQGAGEARRNLRQDHQHRLRPRCGRMRSIMP